MRLILLSLLSTLILFASDKVALVIGNSNYNQKQLPNAKQDATDIASTLQTMGYDVVLTTDATNTKFDNAINEFHNKVIGAEIAVVFYAGHGIEIDKENYMIPLGVKGIYTRRDLSKLVKLSDLIAEAKIAKRFGVLFVDACRDNPLQNRIDPTMRSSVSRGLGQVSDTPSNILVSFATKAGRTTADGVGSNSSYTQALKSFIGENDDIRFVIGKVKDWVVSNTKSSQHPQEPTMFGTLGGDRFCLSGVCQQKVVIDKSENKRLREQIALLKRQQQNVYVAPKVVVEQPVKVVHSTQGTITIDGLMYQNQPFTIEDKTFFDKHQEGGRVWSWNGAKKYCKDLSFEGFTDWRLPKIYELVKLLTKSKNTNSRGDSYFLRQEFMENMPPLVSRYNSSSIITYASLSFWSASGSEKEVKGVTFDKGFDYWDKRQENPIYALCVR